MTTWLHGAALLVTGVGLFSTCAAYWVSRNVCPALAVLVDFLLAAQVIRLADEPSLTTTAVAAAVVAVRTLLSARHDRRASVT
ncbi:DUF1622 domain-containing protein [Streptomyces sp. NPDC057445]|uniref:DUF1622 domain-containing protein n=1 Tax=Streptomyces sp. NPDC057445 TaxID=3346136 RepID=UPI003688195B